MAAVLVTVAALLATGCGPQAPIEVGVREVSTEVRIGTTTPRPAITPSPAAAPAVTAVPGR